MTLLSKILFTSLLALPSFSFGQVAESRLIDFANLRDCYRSLPHELPDRANSSVSNLLSVPQSRFVSGNSQLGVTANAFVIQGAPTTNGLGTQFTVIQQAPTKDEPGFLGRATDAIARIVTTPTEEKEYIITQAEFNNNQVRGHGCASNSLHGNQIRIPVQCTSRQTRCPTAAINVQVENRLLNGAQGHSLCQPTLEANQQGMSSQISLDNRIVEEKIKRAFSAHINYVADNYATLITQRGNSMAGAHGSNSTETAANALINSMHRALDPVGRGSCRKIFPDPDPQVDEPMQRLFCLAAQGSRNPCPVPPSEPAQETPVNNGETL